MFLSAYKERSNKFNFYTPYELQTENLLLVDKKKLVFINDFSTSYHIKCKICKSKFFIKDRI